MERQQFEAIWPDLLRIRSDNRQKEGQWMMREHVVNLTFPVDDVERYYEARAVLVDRFRSCHKECLGALPVGQRTRRRMKVELELKSAIEDWFSEIQIMVGFCLLEQQQRQYRIGMFERMVYTEEDEQLDGDLCNICLQKRLQGNVIIKLPCRHLFHLNCCDTCFKYNRKCPVCQRNYPQE